MVKKEYDLIVIGAGGAGSTVASSSAGMGKRVALIERDRLGGTCLNHGCDPTMATLRTNVPHIWAAGDITSPYQTSYSKCRKGRRLGRLLCYRESGVYADDRVVPFGYAMREVKKERMEVITIFWNHG